MVLADGLIFSLNSADGKLRLVEATPEAYKPLATAQLFPGGQESWAPMALSRGKLVLRDYEGSLKCLEVSGAGAR